MSVPDHIHCPPLKWAHAKSCSTNSFLFSNYIKPLERMTMALSFYYPILKMSPHSEQRLHSLFWNQHFITSTGHISGLQSSFFLVLPPIPLSISPPVFWAPFVPNSGGTFHPQAFRVLALGNSCPAVGSIQWNSQSHVINIRVKRTKQRHQSCQKRAGNLCKINWQALVHLSV